MIAAALSRAAAGVAAFAQGIRAMVGWRRMLAAFVLGMAATAALPPVHALPLLPFAFTGLVWLTEGVRGARGAFAVGWWFGWGHFAAGFYWLAFALLVDAGRFGWMVPFAVFGLSGGLAIFTGLATLALWASRARGAAGALVLAVAWGGVEWLRGNILTGFPWNLIGTVWTESEPMMQVASAVGVLGLGMLTVAAAALPASLGGTLPAAGKRWGGVLAAVCLVVAGWTLGQVRLSAADDDVVPGVRLRLVQPDIPQALKWDPTRVERNFQQTLALSRAAGFERRTVVIWPESGVPFPLNADANRRALLAAEGVPPGGTVIAGALRINDQRGPGFRIWNSLYAVNGAGEIVGLYDKFHLVPFGEYAPFRSILDIDKITVGSTDFSAGPGPVTLALPGLPKLSGLVCYEIIFPRAVIDRADRPEWIVNVTNDAWFGISSGPYQHFAAARFRAVEEGLPVVRAANNGISAVIDSHGRVVARLGLGRRGIVDSDLPRAAAAPLYARHGDLIVLALAAAMAVFALAMHRRV